jgi:hypothetical protein
MSSVVIFTHARPRKGIDLTIKLRVIAVTFGVLASMAAGARPVYAVDVLAARGNVTVNTDFSACGTVTFPRPQAVITGSMIATGFGTTGDTQENALVRDVKPIVARNTSSVKVCTEGLNFVRTPTLALDPVHESALFVPEKVLTPPGYVMVHPAKAVPTKNVACIARSPSIRPSNRTGFLKIRLLNQCPPINPKSNLDSIPLARRQTLSFQPGEPSPTRGPSGTASQPRLFDRIYNIKIVIGNRDAQGGG